MNYCFDSELAEMYGVNEAIMLWNIQHWILKNKATKSNEFAGRTWCYNSAQAWAELFPFWKPKQVSRILNSLENQGVLVTGNFNKVSYDRTKWYAFNDEEAWVAKDKKERMYRGHIYAIENENGNIKIGLTTNLEQRFTALKPVKIHGIYESHQMYRDEKKLHEMFASKRIKGEWFNLDENDLKAIEAFEYTISPYEEIDLPLRGNRFDLKGQPIPNTLPDIYYYYSEGERKIYLDELINILKNSEITIECAARENGLKPATVIEQIKPFLLHAKDTESTYRKLGDVKAHFKNWLRKQELTDLSAELVEESVTWFISKFNEISKGEYVVTDRIKNLFVAAIKNGFTGQQMAKAARNLYHHNNDWHRKSNYEFATPEFLLKDENLNKLLNAKF